MPPSLETVAAQVDSHAKVLDALSSDVRDLRNGQHQSSMELVRIQSDVKSLANDVRQLGQEFKQSQKEILDEQEARRNAEYQELRETLAGRTISFRERVLFIIIPLIVAFIGASIVVWSVVR